VTDEEDRRDEEAADAAPIGVPGAEVKETYRIVDWRLARLQERVEKLNRRAERLGLPPIALAVEGEELEELVFPRGHRLAGEKTGKVNRWLTIRLTGQAPVIEGWKLIARVEHHGAAGNIITKAPGAEGIGVEAYRAAPPDCDHCHTERRRLDTFLLVKLDEADGGVRQIGRNCLADYLRTADATVATRIAFLEALGALRAECEAAEAGDEEGGGGGGGRDLWGLVTFLATTVIAVRKDGWVSRAAERKAEEEGRRDRRATVNEVFTLLMGPGTNADQEERDWHKDRRPTPADIEKAEKVIEWGKALPATTEYKQNLRVALGLDYVPARQTGLVASAVAAYQRAVEKDEERKTRAARPDAGHVGEVGKREDFEGTVKVVRYIEGNYGVTTLIIFETDAGATLKWFASGEKEVDVGDRLTVKATIKQHGEYNGRKETVLTRAKILGCVKQEEVKKLTG